MQDKYKAFHKQTKKVYPVVSLCTHGTIKEHELLDVYSDEADDGIAPTIKVQDVLLDVMRYTNVSDKENTELYAGDIIVYDNDNNMSHWVAGEKAVIVDYGYKMVARMYPFDAKTTGNQNILSDDFSECVTKIGNKYIDFHLLDESK